MEIYSVRPLLGVLIPALASVLILFSARRPKLRETWTIAAAVLQFLIVASLYPSAASGGIWVFRFFDLFPGVTASLRVDSLGITFGLLSSGLWILTSLYNIGYTREAHEKNQTRYFASFALSLSAAVGIAFAGDLFTFFVFYELLTIATYPLVIHKENREAVLAARKYLVYSLGAGAAFLVAIVWAYSLSGRLEFTAGGFLNGTVSPRQLIPLFFLFIYGAAVKAALFPVHAWLPSAMAAPTPVSALLHAVAVVKAGVFAVLRIIGFVFGPELLRDSGLGYALACISGFTVLFASSIALTQDNLKRRLAYSTVSQLSYIILGASLLTPAAFTGSILHLVNHALLKITLFFCAGVIYAKAHKENVSEMKGVGYQLPWTMTAFAAAALGLSGFPPFAGFVSKWFLCQGAFQTQEWGFLMVYLVSGVLNLAYLLPVAVTAFQKPARAASVKPDETPWVLCWPPLASIFLAVLFGCFPWLIQAQIHLAKLAVSGIFGVS